jgi:hypothetical protein
MGLTEGDRGMLEKIIDQQVSTIGKYVKTWRSPEYQKLYQIKDPDDFAYGYAQGSIIAKFETYYALVYNKKIPTADEIDEIAEITLKRSREIKEAIFKSG